MNTNISQVNKELKMKKLPQKQTELLTREKFRELCFKRDKNKCIFCNNTEISCHHIIDRKLFTDGGYYMDNGASVCDEHHWLCEQTDITVEAIRELCNIKTIVLPKGFDSNQHYDKWGF